MNGQCPQKDLREGVAMVNKICYTKMLLVVDSDSSIDTKRGRERARKRGRERVNKGHFLRRMSTFFNLLLKASRLAFADRKKNPDYF